MKTTNAMQLKALIKQKAIDAGVSYDSKARTLPGVLAATPQRFDRFYSFHCQKGSPIRF